jgi:putative tryptophan/tyrosine transport system substrate-binding protein
MKHTIILISILLVIGCKPKNNLPTVAFIDHFEDATLGQAKQGFFDALSRSGFSEKDKSINVIYKNAQGSDITLNQIIQYCKAQQPSLIATCPTTPTIATVQQIKDIPIFMMVAPKPSLMKLSKTPNNLYGVGEDLDYIDTSLALIPKLLLKKNKFKSRYDL